MASAIFSENQASPFPSPSSSFIPPPPQPPPPSLIPHETTKKRSAAMLAAAGEMTNGHYYNSQRNSTSQPPSSSTPPPPPPPPKRQSAPPQTQTQTQTQTQPTTARTISTAGTTLTPPVSAASFPPLAPSPALTSTRAAPPSPSISRRPSGWSLKLSSSQQSSRPLSDAHQNQAHPAIDDNDDDNDGSSKQQAVVTSLPLTPTSAAAPPPPPPESVGGDESKPAATTPDEFVGTGTGTDPDPGPDPPASLIVIRDYAFPSTDDRYHGRGQFVPKWNRLSRLGRKLALVQEGFNGGGGRPKERRKAKKKKKKRNVNGWSDSDDTDDDDDLKATKEKLGSDHHPDTLTSMNRDSGRSSGSDDDDEDDEDEDGEREGMVAEEDALEDEEEDEDEDEMRRAAYGGGGGGGGLGFGWGVLRFGRLSWRVAAAGSSSSGLVKDVDEKDGEPIRGFPSQNDLERNFGQGAGGECDGEGSEPGVEEEELGPLLPGLYRALYAFEPEGTAEMGLDEDQIVKVVGRGGGEGWAVVVDTREGRSGGHALVPESYLELLQLDEDDDGND